MKLTQGINKFLGIPIALKVVKGIVRGNKAETRNTYTKLRNEIRWYFKIGMARVNVDVNNNRIRQAHK